MVSVLRSDFAGAAMKASYMGCWRWLQKRVASAAVLRAPRRSARSRRKETGWLATVAAQVEQLESRQLLTVTFHGGALLPNVEAQAVYLGASWQSNASLQTQKGQIETFVSGLVRSKFMDGLTLAGYNVYRGTSSAGVIDGV